MRKNKRLKKEKEIRLSKELIQVNKPNRVDKDNSVIGELIDSEDEMLKSYEIEI